MLNFSHGNEFDWQDNGHARKTDFHLKGCAHELEHGLLSSKCTK